MKKIFRSFLLPLSLVCIWGTFSECKKNANGRNTLNLVDDATVVSLANQEYTTFLSANPPVQGTDASLMVTRVGTKLTAAVQQYLADVGKSDLIKNYNWEFNLVNNPEVNAWCMPGGKIVVYSGILPLTVTDADLAVVMGHEIAHAVLKHGNERMSDQLLVQYGGQALSVLLSSKPAETQQLFNTAFGVGSNLTVLAFSRRQESEADEFGLYFMAMAGYDPNTAVGFWQRMAAQGGSSNVPVILRSHPSDDTRIKNIQELMPKALTYYHP